MTDHPAVKIWPPVLFWGHVAVGVLLQVFWPVYLDMGRVGEVVGSLLFLCGPLTVMLSVRHMMKKGATIDVTKPADVLVEDGPYRFSRNPIYVAFLVGLFGLGLMAKNAWLVVMVPALAVSLHYLIIKSEEAYLAERFGEEYNNYQSRVRRWF